MARITCKMLGDVTPAERRRLKELTLHEASGMSKDVLSANRNLHEYQVFIAREGVKILAWAAVFPFRNSVTYNAGMTRASHYSAYFYTSPHFRGKGIGHQLFKRVLKFLVKHKARGIVFPWSSGSTAFFDDCRQRLDAGGIVEWH